MNTGIIFDIKRYAIHDGPGIRTTVFFKGCPLCCRWCHNPEGISAGPPRFYRDQRCIACEDCVRACPQSALALDQPGRTIQIDKERCNHCGDCAALCPADALEVSGRSVTVEALMEIIEKDTLFYDQSQGGVTFSGGDPLMQPEFLLAVLNNCGRLNIHRAVDTAGHCSPRTLLEIAAHTDLFLYDLKHMDSQQHKAMTGVSNERVLSNLTLLDSLDVEVNVRVPVVEGINSDDHNIERTGRFLSELTSVKKVSLLPCHAMAQGKYGCLGLDHGAAPIEKPTQTTLQAITRRLERFGLQVKTGG